MCLWNEMKYDAVFITMWNQKLEIEQSTFDANRKTSSFEWKTKRPGKMCIKSFCRNALTDTIKRKRRISLSPSHCLQKRDVHTSTTFDSFCLVQLNWRNEKIELIFIRHLPKWSRCVCLHRSRIWKRLHWRTLTHTLCKLHTHTKRDTQCPT